MGTEARVWVSSSRRPGILDPHGWRADCFAAGWPPRSANGHKVASDLGILTAHIAEGTAMEMHAANDAPGSDYAIEALFLVTLIVLALFVSCVLAWKAMAWLHNRRKGDGVAAEGEQKPCVPEGFGRTLGDGS